MKNACRLLRTAYGRLPTLLITMHDQADQLRKLVRAAVQTDGVLAPGAPIIAISGGQPGVGATTITRQLARELVRLGKQVAVVDANLQGPASTDGPAEGAERACPGLADVLAGTRRAVEVLTDAEEGVRLLPGCRSGDAPQLDGAAVERLLGELSAVSRQVDVVLIDAGSGMNGWIDRLWQFAGQVLLVATPDSSSLLDAYAAVKLSQFHRLEGKVELIVNRCASDAVADSFARRFAETCQRFLFVTPKASASRIAIPTAAGNLPGESDQFVRAVRLLAAELACDFRTTVQRMARPSRSTPRLSVVEPQRSTVLAED